MTRVYSWVGTMVTAGAVAIAAAGCVLNCASVRSEAGDVVKAEVDGAADGDADAGDDADADTDVDVDAGDGDGGGCNPQECDDGNACNGEEVCTADDRCVAGRVPDEGTACTTAGGVAGFCFAERCRPSTCGDGVVNSGEDCDDGNLVDGDGCEVTCRFSCHAAEECREVPDNVCTTDTCDVVAGGQRCGRTNNTAACDDANSCTSGDVCSGGICRGTAIDADDDGYGPGAGCGGDCDDGNRDVNPGATETCNAVDDDCNGYTDDGAGMTCRSGTTRGCTAGGCAGTESCSATTCTWSGVCNVTATEVCNGVDDDCDTATDEGCDGVPCTNDTPCTPDGLVCNESWGICVVASCTGQPNFRPCEIVTAPDRSYDICVSGTCVSPGCGDASCNAPGPNWTLADTSQRSCYNNSTNIACPGTPGTAGCEMTPFCGQDAQYGWDVTHTAAERFTRTPGSEPVVTDNVTGLMWMGCTEGRTGDTCTGSGTRYTWADALARCDGRSWAGYTDWRLPDAYELQSLVDYGRSSAPVIDTTAFPATPVGMFWSSSSMAGLPVQAWAAGFDNGVLGSPEKTATHYVRCVRRGPFVASVPVPRFTRTEPIAGYPVVSDVATGLVWQGCAAGQTGSGCAAGSASRMNWQEALDYCQDSTWTRFTDWYLPSADELRSIVDDHHIGPSADATAFPTTPGDIFWSSSSYAGSASSAWGVDFYVGNVNYHGKASTPNVRCVRRGP